MTAPDRIWLDPASKEPEFYGDDISTGTDGYYASTGDGIPDSEEYIRKGAFPVEELREALDDRYGPETAVAFRAEYKLMERILSLLEGEG